MHTSIRTLIQNQDILVLATADTTTPHTSLMAFAPSDDCTTFYMATYRNTSKFANIAANPRVSLLVDNRCDGGRDRRETMALTVHGQAEILQDPERVQAASDLLRQRQPRLEDFLSGRDIVFIAVKASHFLLVQGPSTLYHETP